MKKLSKPPAREIIHYGSSSELTQKRTDFWFSSDLKDWVKGTKRKSAEKRENKLSTIPQ